MSVENPGVIDAIGTERSSGEVVLTISDHLEWDEREHLLTLQTKINRYLAFIESDEILETYPQAKGKPLRINVVCKYPPSREAELFLGRARQAVTGAGFEFSWQVSAV